MIYNDQVNVQVIVNIISTSMISKQSSFLSVPPGSTKKGHTLVAILTDQCILHQSNSFVQRHVGSHGCEIEWVYLPWCCHAGWPSSKHSWWSYFDMVVQPSAHQFNLLVLLVLDVSCSPMLGPGGSWQKWQLRGCRCARSRRSSLTAFCRDKILG